MITIYNSFPTNPVDFELFMVVPPPSNDVMINWGQDGIVGTISVRSGGSLTIQSAAGFTMPVNAVARELHLLLKSKKSSGYPGVGSLHLEIRSGSPTGSVLATSNVADFNSSELHVDVPFVLSSPVSLVAGQVYFACLSLTGVSGDCLYQLPIKNGGQYGYRMSTSGAWSIAGGQAPVRLVS